MHNKIVPLYDRILIERVEEAESKTSGGIIIPDAAKEKTQIGVVLATGIGRLMQDGKIVPLQVKTGDKVFFAKYAGTDAGENLLLIREDEILAIVIK
jgi:chaperonin GroES